MIGNGEGTAPKAEFKSEQCSNVNLLHGKVEKQVVEKYTQCESIDTKSEISTTKQYIIYSCKHIRQDQKVSNRTINTKFTIKVTSEGREGDKGGTVQPTLGAGGMGFTAVENVKTIKQVKPQSVCFVISPSSSDCKQCR